MMFRMYAGENNSDGIFDWIDTMHAIALKEEAQRLQRAGNFEAALPLMLESVEMRRESHTICLSLSELGELYLDMLKLDEAEAAAHRMLHEAFRYDTEQQTRIAGEIIRDIAAASNTPKWQVCDAPFKCNCWTCTIHCAAFL